MTDIAVTLTHSGYNSVATTAGDFRNLVPLVLMDALSQAGTAVYEPINAYELTAPTTSRSQAMFQLRMAKATFDKPLLQGDTFLLTGTVPVATTEAFKRSLSALSGGEGIFLAQPSGFCKINNPYPVRKRTDNNPLNRKEYMLHILNTV